MRRYSIPLHTSLQTKISYDSRRLLLPEMARRRLARIAGQARNGTQTEWETESLLDFIPRVTPRLRPPTWLAPYIGELERSRGEPVRVVVAAPPQHGKTETAVHALIQCLADRPGKRHAFATYNAKRAARVQRKARLVAAAAGVDGEFRQDDWLLPSGSSLLWASRKGGLTGEPIDGLFIIDDILKDRIEADSATTRDECVSWFDEVAETRCHPGASIVVMATRWHPEDLSGVLVERGWRYVNLMALADGAVDAEGRVVGDPLRRAPGEALCPALRPREALEQKREANPYSFAALYQGQPRPRGAAVFGPAHYYDELPRDGYYAAYGVDLAYTKKKYADWSVIIELWCVPGPAKSDPKTFYVVDCIRKQVPAPEFALTLHTASRRRPGKIRWYASGTEKGVGQFIATKIKGINVLPAVEDKFQRAQPLAEAWNLGRVLIPSGGGGDDDSPPSWAVDLIDELGAFTGVDDKQDDQVDALAAAFDEAAAGKFTYGPAPSGMGAMF